MRTMATLPIIRRGLLSSFANAFQMHLLRFASSSSSLDIFVTDILLPKKTKPSKLIDTTANGLASTRDRSERSELLKKVTSEQQTVSDVRTWNQNEIDYYLIVSIDCGDRKSLIQIIEQMLELKRLPSDAIILRVLSYLCDDENDSMAIISRLIDLCLFEFVVAKNVEFIPFLSQYLWKLKRYDDAINTLNSIYATTNKAMRSNILRNYRKIISVAVENCDEHVVELIISNAEYVNSKYQDPILIIFVWSDCFFSELFRNQRRADDLFTAYDAIPKAVTKQIRAIALQLICTHNIDGIHRLIETLLKNAAHKKEVNVLLLRLFDYHCEFCPISKRFDNQKNILMESPLSFSFQIGDMT